MNDTHASRRVYECLNDSITEKRATYKTIKTMCKKDYTVSREFFPRATERPKDQNNHVFKTS